MLTSSKYKMKRVVLNQEDFARSMSTLRKEPWSRARAQAERIPPEAGRSVASQRRLKPGTLSLFSMRTVPCAL